MAQTPEQKRYAAKKRRLMLLFRITPEEQDNIENYQKKHPPYDVLLGKHNGTDHCHASGKIRGRLDFRINRALGMLERAFKDDTINVIGALYDYLTFNPASLALGEDRYGLIGQARVKRKMVYGKANS